MPLNTKQSSFVEHYLRLNNATQAAIEAGYSAKTAAQIGSRLLKNVEIAARVRERTETVLGSLKMEADEVLVRLATIARGSMASFLDFDAKGKLKIDLAKAKIDELGLVKRIKLRPGEFGTEIEFDLYDAQDALKTLAKHHGLVDKAMEIDWRDEIKKAGLDPAEMFEQMVQQASEKLAGE